MERSCLELIPEKFLGSSVKNAMVDLSFESNHPSKSSENVFFNSQIPISDYQKLVQDDNVNDLFENWNQFQSKYLKWMSSGTPPRIFPIFSPKPLTKFPFPLSPPPGFPTNPSKLCLSDLSTESEITPGKALPKISNFIDNVILHSPPPKLAWIKRQKRGSFHIEEVSSQRLTGSLKFYQLKKRFGFICLDIDNSDIFICEDDLVISKVNLKKFKEAVYLKIKILMTFLVKKYVEDEVEKRKAIEIEIV